MLAFLIAHSSVVFCLVLLGLILFVSFRNWGWDLIGWLFAYAVLVAILHQGVLGYVSTTLLVMGGLGLVAIVSVWAEKATREVLALVGILSAFVLASYLWLWQIGSYSYLRDSLGILGSVGVVSVATRQNRQVWKTLFHGGWKHITGGTWPMEQLTAMGLWILLLSWVALSFLDWTFPPTPVSLDQQRFRALPNAWPSVHVGVTLSGGGYRAALLHAGVLHALEAQQLRVSAVSAVSGGAIIGSVYTLGGKPEDFVAAVGRGAFNLGREFFNVFNLVRMVPGFASLDRTLLQANLVDQRLLHGQRARDRQNDSAPKFLLGTTDLQNSLMVGLTAEGVLLRSLPTPYDKLDFLEEYALVFWFPPRFLRAEDGSLPGKTQRLAELVATSGAFPFAFSPQRYHITIPPGRWWGDASKDAPADLTLMLTDGGLTDNSGLRLLLDAHNLAKRPRKEISTASIPPRTDVYTTSPSPPMDAGWAVDLVLVSDGARLLQEDARISAFDLTRVMDVIAESTGTPPARSWVRFALTEETLQALEEDHLPETILTKLRSVSTVSFGSEKRFLTEVRTVLSQEEFTQYKTKLLYHCRYTGPRPQPTLLLLSPARLVMRLGAVLHWDKTLVGQGDTQIRPMAMPHIPLTELTASELMFLADLLPNQPQAHEALRALMTALTEERPTYPGAQDAFTQELLGPAQDPRVARFDKMIWDDVAWCLRVFQTTSTLKDRYQPEDAAAIYRLGQYLVLMRWPEIKAALEQVQTGRNTASTQEIRQQQEGE